MKKKEINLFPLILAFLLLGLAISIIGLVKSLNEKKLFDINETVGYYSTKYNSCEGLGMTETAYCLQAYIKDFYNYNESNKNLELSFERLKAEGGVCWHYADLYSQLAKKYGFEEKQIGLPGHVFTLMYDDTGYCVLDQMQVMCMGYDNKTTKEVMQNGRT